MKRPFWIVLFVSVICLTSCNIPVPAGSPSPTAVPVQPSNTPQPQATSTPLATPTVLPVLSETILKNQTYVLPQSGKTVTLVDGKFQSGSGADSITAVLLPQMAFGDLNGDGIEDAAVLIGENMGGSGVFVSLIVFLNQNGQPVQGASVLVDDRPKVNSLAIRNGEIIVEATIHGANDVMALPTLSVVENYQLLPGGLTLARFVSKTPGGAERAIIIKDPLSGSDVNASVQVRGSMPIGPLENNLRLRVYDLDGNVLLEGPFGVSAPDMGAPATFDNLVDISSVSPGTKVRLELAELSMKDGSILSLDSVILTRK
jgi:hypothetical protein